MRAVRTTFRQGARLFLGGSTDAEEQRRATLTVLIALVGIAVLVPLGAIAFVEGNSALAWVDIGLALILALNLIDAGRRRRHGQNIAVGVSFTVLLFVYAFLTGGVNQSAFVWYFSFPLIACFLLGSRRGGVLSAAMLLPVAWLFSLETPPAPFADYPLDLRIRFVPSYLVVAALSFLSERTREAHRDAFQRANDNLERSVAARTAELTAANTSLEAEIGERIAAEGILEEQVRLLALSADTGRTLTGTGSMGEILDGCARHLVEHLGANFARIWTMDDSGETLVLRASSGLYTHLDGKHSRIRVGELKIGRIAEQRRPMLTNSVIGDPAISDQAWARREGMKAFAGHPLISSGRVVGVMALFSRRPLTGIVTRAISSIADEIAVGIERMRSVDLLAGAKAGLERQNEELRTLDRMKDSLISDVSHELKTPVAKHAMQIELLRRRIAGHPAEAEIGKTIEVMEAGIRRQRSVISNMLMLSRLERGGRSFRNVPVPLGLLLEQVAEDYRSLCREGGVELRTALDAATVLADQEMLWHVFSNLIGNSFKYRGAHEPWIAVELRAVGDEAVASVIDNGVGFTDEERERAFDRFYQAASSKEGSGIGLSIARNLVTTFGGTIRIDSPGRDRGSRVEVRLPLATTA